MVFSYHIYSVGAGITNMTSDNWLEVLPQAALWFTVSAGTVGMAYLCSILLPHHWSHGHRLQGLFCILGVLIATSVTILFSLAYRSEEHAHYAFDLTIQSWLPFLADANISPIQIFASIAPPFWGLFWMVIQPTEERRDDMEGVDAEEKIRRIQARAQIEAAEAEAKAVVSAARAKAGAVKRQAQLEGVAATFRVGANQIKGDQQEVESPDQEAPVPTLLSDTTDIPIATGSNAEAQTQRLKPGTKLFNEAVKKHIGLIEASGTVATAELVAQRMGETVANVLPAFNKAGKAR